MWLICDASRDAVTVARFLGFEIHFIVVLVACGRVWVVVIYFAHSE